MQPVGHKRVILKLSGEALSLPGSKGIDPEKLDGLASRLKEARATGTQIGIVTGAGNFIRGVDYAGNTVIRRTTADYMGMLATTMNALALRDAIEERGVPARVVSAMPLPTVTEEYYRPSVMRYLDEGVVVIFAGGTGHPGVTTDMCAAIRANEIGADIILKATKVDGVYDGDPETNPDARKYDQLTHEEALAGKLGVMDLAALAFCMDKGIPILVFNITVADNLVAAITGARCGTIVKSS